jgi:hypothetical protein
MVHGTGRKKVACLEDWATFSTEEVNNKIIGSCNYSTGAELAISLIFYFLLGSLPVVRNLKTISFFIAVAFTASSSDIYGQYHINGRVLDSIGLHPIESVSVLSSNGHGTLTDSNGRYQLEISDGDSIWFSYLGKETVKYPARYVIPLEEFDIALSVNIPILKEVRVRSRDYKYDSIENRQTYASVFNYRKPTFHSVVTSISPLGITINIDELIRSFGKKKIRRQLNFQQRLLNEERNKFIDHRFTRLLVHRITGATAPAIETFMVKYRPGYLFTLTSSDYDFFNYIRESYADYLHRMNPQTP